THVTLFRASLSLPPHIPICRRLLQQQQPVSPSHTSHLSILFIPVFVSAFLSIPVFPLYLARPRNPLSLSFAPHPPHTYISFNCVSHRALRPVSPSFRAHTPAVCSLT
ncbi:unnamed protein product, partial [Ectocarpus sp. 13 AM-2016]